MAEASGLNPLQYGFESHREHSAMLRVWKPVRVRARVLYLTDLTYQAHGRRYCDEDIRLSSDLRHHFDLALCHPRDAVALMDDFEVLVVRNTGPVMHYQESYDAFTTRARDVGAKVFTELKGKADQRGKQYLLDLYAAGFPVIPTIECLNDIELLPTVPEYVLKPKAGADSVGLRFVNQDELITTTELADTLVQPRIDVTYEVSFYFVGRKFHYSLHAPNPETRWNLEPYRPSDADLRFAQMFVDWNTIDHGIQRVDACRTADGELLLMELEDLNPYLSLDLVDSAQRQLFVDDMVVSIEQLAGAVDSHPSVRAHS
jgi:hypothetical protein